MKLLILPGFSSKNKVWAEECATFFQNDFDITVHEWKHWNTRNASDFSAEKEVEIIRETIASENVNVIAKSVGTYISMFLLDKINKLILCGIFSKEDKYKNLSEVIAQNVVIFQNDNDPLLSFEEVKEFVNSINPEIKVISKNRSDHSYPFYEDFKKFLLY